MKMSSQKPAEIAGMRVLLKQATEKPTQHAIQVDALRD